MFQNVSYIQTIVIYTANRGRDASKFVDIKFTIRWL